MVGTRNFLKNKKEAEQPLSNRVIAVIGNGSSNLLIS
jgi:hypothetical protein